MVHVGPCVSSVLRRPSETDPEAMGTLLSQIGEFQANDRPCFKKTRWISMEGVSSCPLSPTCTDTYMPSHIPVTVHMYTCKTNTCLHWHAYMYTHTHTTMKQVWVSHFDWLVQDANHASSVASIVDSWEESNTFLCTELEGFMISMGHFLPYLLWRRKPACEEGVNRSLEEWAHFLQKWKQEINKTPTFFVCGSRKPSGRAVSSENSRCRLKWKQAINRLRERQQT